RGRPRDAAVLQGPQALRARREDGEGARGEAAHAEGHSARDRHPEPRSRGRGGACHPRQRRGRARLRDLPQVLREGRPHPPDRRHPRHRAGAHHRGSADRRDRRDAAKRSRDRRLSAGRQMPTNKVAIVTGASTGIGKAVALALLKEGYSVALAARRQEMLDEAVRESGAGSRALAVVTDVSKPESIKALFAKVKETFGRLDVLFNNAGMGAPAIPMEELTLEQWQNVVNAN